MKNYTITVNGNVYNVTVEEGTTAGVVQAPAAAPKAAPAAPKAAAPAGAQGSVVVTAPMRTGCKERRRYYGSRGYEDGERYRSSSGWNRCKH